jgi:hypothetical protein
MNKWCKNCKHCKHIEKFFGTESKQYFAVHCACAMGVEEIICLEKFYGEIKCVDFLERQ